MNKTDASKNKIFEKLELINEQAEMLKLHQGEIPQLYIDLLKKNVLKLYESVHNLDQLKHTDESIPQSTKSQPQVAEEVQKREAPQVKQIPEPEPQAIKVEPPIKQEIKTEPPKIENSIQSNSEINSATKEANEMPIVNFGINKPSEKPTQSKPVIHPGSDLFADTVPSIADKLSAQQDPSLGETMQQNHITNIKSAIGINEKFLFINELFGGNLQDYNQSIDQLNLAKNLAEATSIFNLFQEKFNWDDENEAVAKLKLTMSRKYSLV